MDKIKANQFTAITHKPITMITIPMVQRMIVFTSHYFIEIGELGITIGPS
jgi:hypothetical protein